MNVTISRPTRQILAVGLLVLVIVMVWSLLLQPILGLALGRQAEVSALSDRLAQLRAAEARVPLLGQRERIAAQQLKALDVLWSGPSRTAIAASMQDLVRAAAQQSGGVVSSTSMLPRKDTQGSDTLAVRARVEGTLDTLQHVLTIVDDTRPKLFVNDLTVSAAAPSSRDRPQQLSFEFSVSGYLAEAQHAH